MKSTDRMLQNFGWQILDKPRIGSIYFFIYLCIYLCIVRTKDRDVAQFLYNGTKWDNMLGEFRKVYEWEKGSERKEIGKSYFRLSPYERKLHRLPASFDEEVYEELAQFMGFRQRASQQKNLQASATRLVVRDSSKELTPKETKDNISNALLPPWPCALSV
jgi:hypothetical protein